MTYGQQLQIAIDAEYEISEAEDGMRKHLGASIIGDKCMRAVWFQFRWCSPEAWEGRMLRLVDRGQREEEIFADLLRRQGATVWQTDPATGRQFIISEHGGHYGGSTDGFAINLPELPGVVSPKGVVLLEMKTHNDRWFKQLEKSGVLAVKPEHYKQAQAYLHGFNTRGWDVKQCLYAGLNKNDESLYFELFNYDAAEGAQLLDKAESIIFAPGLPPRISERPSYYGCQFCDAKEVCFKQKAPRVNCRTCVHSKPERDGQWTCARQREEIATSPKVGCEMYEVIPELKPF